MTVTSKEDEALTWPASPPGHSPVGCLGPLPFLTTEPTLSEPWQSLGGLTMQCDNHCLPFPITVETWTPGTEILINPSSKMALAVSSMVVDAGLFVFQGLSTSWSDGWEVDLLGECVTARFVKWSKDLGVLLTCKSE